jgi:hypothetical protein
MPAFSDFLIDFDLNHRQGPDRCSNVRAELQADWRLRISYDRQPLSTCISTSVWTSCTVGEIYRYRGNAGTTNECVTAFLNEAAAGKERPEELAGSFAIAAWNQVTRCWSVWTDHAGKIHVYYSEGPHRAIGTYSPAVYEYSSQKLDWPALTGFFCFGFFPQDRTHYDDVRVVRPASRYDFDGSGRLVRQQTYWHWEPLTDHKRSERDTLHEFGAVLGAAVADQTNRGTVALPLSGGLDSRTVAALLPKHTSVQAYSYGYSPKSVETQIAGRIARVKGLKFYSHVIQPYLMETIPTVMEAVEGFQDVTQARQAAIADWLNDRADYVLAAHWGDVLCSDMGCSDGSDGWSQSLLRFKKRGRSWLLENVCRNQLNGESPEKVAECLLRSEFNQLQHIKDPDFRVKVLKTRQWAHRWTLASVRMYQKAAYPRTPFLDPRVLNFFGTVPTWMLRQRRLQIEYLKAFCPDVARIVWQKYGASLYHFQHYNSWLLPKRIYEKASRIVRGPEVSRNWELQFFSPGRQDRLYEMLTRKSSFLSQITSLTDVRSLLERFSQEKSPADAYTVSMLLTMEAWGERVHRA